MSVKNVTVSDLGNVLNTPFMMSGSKDLIKTGWKGDIENFSKKLWKYSWPRTRDYTMAVIMLTVVVAASKASNIEISAKKRDENYKKLEEDENISLSEYINKKVKKSKISDLFKKIVNIEKSGDASNIADSISKENMPHGWFAKCFINLLLASKDSEEDAKKVFKNFLGQVKKMTKWKINKSYMNELTEVINNALLLDIDSWGNRYDNTDETKELKYEDYEKFYVARSSDGRYLHGYHFEKGNSNTRKLDNKFITSVMERRYGHLQQAKFVIKRFIDGACNAKNTEKELDDAILSILKKLNKDEKELQFEQFYEECSVDLPYENLKNCFYELYNNDTKDEAISELKHMLKANIDMSTISELYKLIDDLLKHLLRYPEKIPNLKLSGASVNKIQQSFDYVEKKMNGMTLTNRITDSDFRMSQKNELFMVTSDDTTDRILAVLEYPFLDNSMDQKLALIWFFYYVTSIPSVIVVSRGLFEKIPKSKNFPNPYRGKYGVK